jgi:hypothetical protein
LACRKSISLQEENAIPGPELKKNADVVVETSHTLVAITREVASTDYKVLFGSCFSLFVLFVSCFSLSLSLAFLTTQKFCV